MMNNLLNEIKDIPLIKMLQYNEYEKIVPINLWFHNDKYKIVDQHENNQHLRLRYYQEKQLTPIVFLQSDNLESIKSCLEDLSLYQPFYPETFYVLWDFFGLQHLNFEYNTFLSICNEERFGSLESLIFYQEKYNSMYQRNIYHLWKCGNEQYDIYNDVYIFKMPDIDYLGQCYKLKILESSKDLIKYDFIYIDAINKLDNIFEWKKEMYDLYANIFYIIMALKKLNINGGMIIRLNLISSKNWYIIFDIMIKFFKEYTFYRSPILNPFNSEIYLYLNLFMYDKWLESLTSDYLSSLYQNEYYKIDNTIKYNKDNPILKKYKNSLKKWKMNIKKKLKDNFVNTSIEKVNKWYKSNEIHQIRDLKNIFCNDILQFNFDISINKIQIKSMPSDLLYYQSFYKKIIKKRAELNYYKRIMDTKPSQIFLNNRYNSKSKLLTWEKVTYELNIYRTLKYILETDYHAEMVSNAWIKMYEMLNMFGNLIPNKNIIKTFHLCEAPGAFISATNHYLSNKNQKLEWYAQTLKQTNSGSITDAALDDYYGMISSYRDRWIFGPEDNSTGNITDSKIIKYYANHKKLQDIDFMTSDAGLYCKPEDLNEQETFLGKINMGQIICILACLSKGKSALFKTFLPMTEPLTISMIYILTNLFEKVTITKPKTSNNTSSEVYIILYNYYGIKKHDLDLLYLLLDEKKITSKTLLFSHFDNNFTKSYTNNITKFIDRQISALCYNYYYYYNYKNIKDIIPIRNKCLNEWLENNPILVLTDHINLNF